MCVCQGDWLNCDHVKKSQPENVFSSNTQEAQTLSSESQSVNQDSFTSYAGSEPKRRLRSPLENHLITQSVFLWLIITVIIITAFAEQLRNFHVKSTSNEAAGEAGR